MIDVRCPICKNRHLCMEIGINASEGCGMFVLDDLPKKPQTNADRIRSMTDEELANFLALQQIGVVTAIYKAFDEPVPDAMTGARKEWLDWLRQEGK